MTEEVATRKLEELFDQVNDTDSEKRDYSAVRSFIEEKENDAEVDMKDLAFLIACQKGEYDYVTEYYDEVDLEDGDGGSCTYFYETEDEDIRDFFISIGCHRDPFSFSEMRYAYSYNCEEVYAFEDSLRRELYEGFLKAADKTEAEFVEKLAESDHEVEDDDEENVWLDDGWETFTPWDVAAILKLDVKDGKVILAACGLDAFGSGVIDLINALDFDGVEEDGFYFVE